MHDLRMTDVVVTIKRADRAFLIVQEGCHAIVDALSTRQPPVSGEVLDDTRSSWDGYHRFRVFPDVVEQQKTNPGRFQP